MSLRESINRYRGATLVVALIAVVLAVINLVWRMQSDGGGDQPTKAFFTTDDGRTWFEDDISKLSPFDHNGKTAYRCYVYSADEGKTKFACYLERFSEDAKKVLRQPRSGVSNQQARINEQTVRGGTEVKAAGTGDSGWVKLSDPRALDIMTPRSHDRSNREFMPVEP